MISKKFDKLYEQFLNELESSEYKSESYFELSKDNESHCLKFHGHRYKKIFLSIPFSKNQLKILDIGTTPFTFFIKKAYEHYDVSTIDLTDLMAKRCKDANITFKKCNLVEDKIPFEDGSFDVVIFTEVFEHLFMPPHKILSEISRILKHDGVMIFGTPNYTRLVNKIRLLFGINPMTPIDDMTKDDWVHGHGHVREYTMKECISILKDNGFVIEKATFEPYWDIIDVQYLKVGGRAYLIPFMVIYYLCCLIFPGFRSGIYIICKKL